MSGIDHVVLNFDAGNLRVLNIILAVVMFSIALDLRLDDFRRVARGPKPLIVGLVSQFLVLPTLTFLMILALQPMPSVAMGLILVAACPGGNISNFMTHRAQGNVALSVSMTAFATVGAILITPANIAFWGNLYGPTREILQRTEIDPVAVAITVGFMLVLPLILGMLVNARLTVVADRIRRPMQWLSMGIFLAFIVLALAANWGNFLQVAGAIIGLVVFHNALAFLGGFTTATLAGLSERDRRSVTIETGIQNSGLGLILIFAFFGGLGGMAVAAALWGIWHAISGLALASFFARREGPA
ncbi:bile acid:Na+ symporter, BASS family [Aliiroseovarius halocynthiae]|uniref:Bile acid:sodium symporter family protein n=1 Tax=Aliiroseovarius halocynthiae TaxID=985055 RepID=A0A545SU24_9RHOB|nr:bile acid:sodium symporter family protein [Aliiroseovarius halocynthiae]TQV68465.1 bile acid:sodium symporter family protein [Aliiroseovarius halocynthiae]SMR70862.1 bile acid:Na+ symporter, BASS family [Aliiroseovarius halocynthiae]